MVVKKSLKKTMMAVLALTVSILVNGCLVHSIHPFYTADTLLTLPDIKGRWLPVKKNCGKAVIDTEGRAWTVDDHTIRAIDNHGIPSTLKYKVFKIGNHHYIDTIIANNADEEMGKLALMHVVPLHTICRLELQNECATVTPMNIDKVKTFLGQGKPFLPYQEVDNHLFFTASSEQWLAFLRNGENTDAFFTRGAIHFARSLH